MFLEKLENFFTNPLVALFLIILFCLSFFIYNGLTGHIDKKFIAFGPTLNEDGEGVDFLGMKLDTWNHVIIAYLLIFFTSIFNNYYSNIIDHNVLRKITNVDIINLPYNKLFTYTVTLLDPFIKILLYVISFFATATFQLQFIIPQFLGSYIVNLPFTLRILKQKTFI